MDGVPALRYPIFSEGTHIVPGQFAVPFYGTNRDGVNVSEGILDSFWLQCSLTGFAGCYLGIKAFSETDFNEDLKKFDIPTLIMHGDDDQIVPIAISALKSAKLIKDAVLRIYPRFPHGMCQTHKDVINADLLAFVQGKELAATTATGA